MDFPTGALAPLSFGASQLLKDIQDLQRRYGKAFKSQATYAAHFGVAIRTIKRWSRELRAAGEISFTQARGCVKPCWKLLADVPLNVPLNVPLSPALIRNEYCELEQNGRSLSRPVERKPPERAQTASRMPEQWTVNEFGRRDINPDWQRVNAALLDARWRIQGARNPVAYEQAIIRRALESRAS